MCLINLSWPIISVTLFDSITQFRSSGSLQHHNCYYRRVPILATLVTSHGISRPALISVNFSFLLRLSEVKYHWWKGGKGDKTVNLLIMFDEKRSLGSR